MRVRWDNNQDTPLPPEVPQGQNPPDGVAIDYYLRSAATGPVTITIRDASGAVVREYTERGAAAGHAHAQRAGLLVQDARDDVHDGGHAPVVWDLRSPTPPALDFSADGTEADTVSFGIIAPAIKGRSPKQQAVGPLVLPGTTRCS